MSQANSRRLFRVIGILQIVIIVLVLITASIRLQRGISMSMVGLQVAVLVAILLADPEVVLRRLGVVPADGCILQFIPNSSLNALHSLRDRISRAYRSSLPAAFVPLTTYCPLVTDILQRRRSFCISS